ncbi:MAG: LytTR family DNA-binding domain-containing protein [Gemmatimonadales bacterium]
MSTLRVIVVDDEPLARERVSALVRECEGFELVGEGANGLEALDLIAAHSPDLLFIDVEMPELSGFGVVAALDAADLPGVVFITAYEHYAVRAFEVGAIDYLQKPVTPARFAAAASRARDRVVQRSAQERLALIAAAAQAERDRGVRSRFVVRHGSLHQFVPVETIDWLDVAHNYVRLHVGAQIYFWRGTMKEAVAELDAVRFARIHRSIVVAIEQLTSARALENGGYAIELRCGAKLRASRAYAQRVRELIERHQGAR